ncbi:putative quinol monooxygenase [Streptomyces sp. NPDC101132]|uniref:putative quinol monooxygenase n=1 Tax=Streptomyces sp. NPDC101132 TaxID=3366110 RepID=UPI003800AB5B
MIFITVRFAVRPEHADNWPVLVDEFTRATRAEPGNLFFDWSRSVEDPTKYTLVEGFTDSAAGAAHVAAPHFKAGLETMAGAIAATPEIIHTEIPGEGWSPMAELAPRP